MIGWLIFAALLLIIVVGECLLLLWHSYRENMTLRAALERLIKDYEDETGEKARVARAALTNEQKP